MKIFKNGINDAFYLAVIAALCGGSVVVAAKIALQVFQPFTLIFIRFFFATLFMLPFVFKTKELSIGHFKRFSVIGFIGSLNPILLFIALPYTLASVSPLIYAGVPALTAVYMYFNKGDTLTKKQVFGIILGLIGVTIIVILPLLDKRLSIDALKGNIIIFIAAIAFMVYGLMSKKAQREFKVSPTALTFYFCFYTLLVSIPFALNEVVMAGFSQQIQLKHVLNSIYIGIVGTGIFYLAYQYALKLGSAVAASLFTYLQPIATIILAMLFLGEKISPVFIVGGLLAVGGARLAANK